MGFLKEFLYVQTCLGMMLPTKRSLEGKHWKISANARYKLVAKKHGMSSLQNGSKYIYIIIYRERDIYISKWWYQVVSFITSFTWSFNENVIHDSPTKNRSSYE